MSISEELELICFKVHFQWIRSHVGIQQKVMAVRFFKVKITSSTRIRVLYHGQLGKRSNLCGKEVDGEKIKPC